MNTSEEDAEDESKHPNILKNKEELDETAKSEEEGVNQPDIVEVNVAALSQLWHPCVCAWIHFVCSTHCVGYPELIWSR